MAGDAQADIPDTGAVFTFGRSRFANNAASHFFIRNDPVVEMSCGDEHTAVVCQNGRVFAFGSNTWGQLGLGHKNTATMPSCVKSLKPEKATHVACGKSHTIVSTHSGKVFSFGSNMDCQLGLGDTEERATPTEVAGIFAGEDGVRMLAAGCQHSAVLTVDGGVYVWGSNSDGQLGLGESVTVVDTPKRIDLPHTIAYISCGYYHTALVTEEGQLLMCGEGENGKLGLSRENRNVFVPTPVNINVPIRSVACGGNHTIAVSMDGDVYGFGSNLSGQLGLGREVLSFSVPECVETLLGKHICAAACGEIHTAFLTVEGHMYACGDGRHGKLCIEIENGDEGSVQCTPQSVTRFSQYRVKQVACGGCHTMVQAVMEADTSKNDANELVNGDVSLRLKKVDTGEREKTPAMLDGSSRVLPPLQNAPVLNGLSEKSPINGSDDMNPENDDKNEASALDNKNEASSALNGTAPELQNGEADQPITTNGHNTHSEQHTDLSPVENDLSEHNGQSNSIELDSSSNIVNGERNSVDKLDIIEDKDNVYSKFNLRDASDLASETQNGTGEREEEADEVDTPRTIKADDGQESVQKVDDRRCSVDVTPTLTVTGTDGVDLDSEETNTNADGNRTDNKPNLISSFDKGEGRMAKFLNAFRRKKLSEENVSVNAAWTDVERRISSENNLKNGKNSSQIQIRSGLVHKSKACVIL
ncbi:X-linked retinitis pigmentosa GTPase regulator-like isoform X2 [Thrips palmi]|uniref:X-linked retinitis pigmentosa GTPase regulator-like isoform X2 n=1 Tax=Thrips palmi TaxID=161013 RepID=A0A6P8YNG4_THRPL|nr:X-linked retinitis pigmentosa GTPase regulator-like isoform X2 [Thrips palmi]